MHGIGAPHTNTHVVETDDGALIRYDPENPDAYVISDMVEI